MKKNDSYILEVGGKVKKKHKSKGVVVIDEFELTEISLVRDKNIENLDVRENTT